MLRCFCHCRLIPAQRKSCTRLPGHEVTRLQIYPHKTTDRQYEQTMGTVPTRLLDVPLPLLSLSYHRSNPLPSKPLHHPSSVLVCPIHSSNSLLSNHHHPAFYLTLSPTPSPLPPSVHPLSLPSILQPSTNPPIHQSTHPSPTTPVLYHPILSCSSATVASPHHACPELSSFSCTPAAGACALPLFFPATRYCVHYTTTALPVPFSTSPPPPPPALAVIIAHCAFGSCPCCKHRHS